MRVDHPQRRMLRCVTQKPPGVGEPFREGLRAKRVSDKQVKPCDDTAKRDQLFFSDDMGTQREAAALCFDCPAFEACGKLGKDEPYGVWGGTTMEDREAGRNALAAEAAIVSADTRAEAIADGSNTTYAEIVRMTAEGKSKAEIVAALGVSRTTVHRVRSASAALVAA